MKKPTKTVLRAALAIGLAAGLAGTLWYVLHSRRRGKNNGTNGNNNDTNNEDPGAQQAAGPSRKGGSPMKKRLRIILQAVLAIGLVAGLAGMLWQQLNYRQGDKDYSDAQQLAAVPPVTVAATEAPTEAASEPAAAETPTEPPSEEPVRLEDVDPQAAALAQTDLAALQAVNSEVLGWIAIPGTEVNYPLMYRSDNDYYLEHTWKGERSSVGAIFVDARNQSDFTDGNTIIYGHNMRNRSMFGGLKYYQNEGHWETCPSVYIVDGSGVRRYDVYAAYEASVEAATYHVGFSDDASKEAFIQYGLDRSLIDTGVVPTPEDQIITLSTCTGLGYATRWVLQACLVDPVELASADPAGTGINLLN